MGERFSIFLLFTIGMNLFCGVAALAQDAGGRPPLEILRGSPQYDFVNEILTVAPDEKGLAAIEQEELSVTAQHLVYNMKSEILNATGDARLWDHGSILRGESLQYNFAFKSGSMMGVQNSELSDGVYFSGKQLDFEERTAEPVKGATEPQKLRVYTMHDGMVTTNDMPYPYYQIDYDKLVLMPNKRMWVYNLTFVTNGVPLMYSPFYTKSLREHRVAYFIEVGSYRHLGTAVFNRILYRMSEEYTFNVYGDYYSRIGFGKGAKAEFDVNGPYGPKGFLYGYHIDQDGSDNDNIFEDSDRYHIAGTYGQDLPYNMRLQIQGHKLSDSEYRWDFRRPERVREMKVRESEKDPVSFINLSKTWEDQSARITYASRFEPFYYNGLPYVERLPEIHVEQYPMRLFGSGIYAVMRLDYGRYRREEGATYPINKNVLFDQTNYVDDVERYDAELTLSYPLALPSNFHLKPWLGYRGTYYGDPSRSIDDPNLAGYQFTEYDFDSEMRSMPEGGLELSTRRTYEFDPFLDRFARMRAVVEPVLQYSYYHPDNALEEIMSGPARFPYIDPTDEIRYQMHRVSSLVRTTIQGKNEAGFSSDFAYLAAGASFDMISDGNLKYDNFEYFDDPAEHDDYRFSDLIEEFRIYPFPWISLGNTLRYDIDDSLVRSSYYYANLNPVKTLELSAGFYTYEFPFLYHNAPYYEEGGQEDLIFSLRYDISKKWQVYYSTRYDVDSSVFRSNRVGLLRDLYDFYALFEVEYEEHPFLEDDLSFNFSIHFWGIGGRQGQNIPVRF
ncbi:MAG: hypothetical protein AB1656_02275 [Candidatus Omnitrophota bacterium]